MTLTAAVAALRTRVASIATNAGYVFRYENVADDPPTAAGTAWVDEATLDGPVFPASLGPAQRYRHTGQYGCRVHVPRGFPGTHAARTLADELVTSLRTSPVLVAGAPLHVTGVDVGPAFTDDASWVLPVTVSYRLDLP